MEQATKQTLRRFWNKVRKTKSCWKWIGATASGYGTFRSKTIKGGAHRIAYELANGQIPPGLTIDHLCRIRTCVKPDHLEAVTMKENLRRGNGWSGLNFRKTHCPQGHPLIEGNLCREKYGRKCLICRRSRDCVRAAKRRLDPVYVKKNRERTLAYYYTHRDRDRLIRRERGRQWRLEHPESAKRSHAKYNPVYYAKNKERLRAYRRAYYVAHHDRVIESNRKWKQNNPEKVRQQRLRASVPPSASEVLEVRSRSESLA